MVGYIYKITNNVNDKVYIGQTIRNIKRRFAQHKRDSRKNPDTIKLYRAMNKYGTESFSVELIEECDRAKLDEREMYWIAEYDSFQKRWSFERAESLLPIEITRHNQFI